MAVMYPRTLDEREVKSAAEAKVFAALEERLGDGWEVFHSMGWVARDKETGSDGGEIDFVIAHPEQGILCLEVKGGGIECRHGEWYGIHDGRQERIRDPFAQAIDHTHALRRVLGGMPAKGGGELLIGHGLAFPDISVHELVLAPDAPPELIIDRNETATIDEAVERCLAYHRPAGADPVGPGANGMKKLRETLAPNVRIEVPMAEEFLAEEEALITLTHDQAVLLQHFGRDKRMVVTGPAGSGKTMLAVERAKRLAAKGEDVLFVCFNRRLRDHLRKAERNSGVYFQTFHGLCTALAKQAEVLLSVDKGGDYDSTFFGEELPLALLAAVEELGPQYDALFVDEAQDLHNDWLEALMATLRDPDDALVWLFMDDNQRVYENQLDVPDEFRPFDLIHNCRNTQAIHREVMKKYEGEVEPEAIGPEGREVAYYETNDQPATVRAIVAELCGKEEIPPQDIVVLSSHGKEKSAVAEAGCGRYTFVDEPRPLGDYIRFASIRGFKGLESPVVILCELEGLDDETIDQQLYVGLSRARNHCVIVAPG
jgi:AAA domain/Nuclease-related domain/UvrD-like helicase C-terminal domain